MKNVSSFSIQSHNVSSNNSTHNFIRSSKVQSSVAGTKFEEHQWNLMLSLSEKSCCNENETNHILCLFLLLHHSYFLFSKSWKYIILHAYQVFELNWHAEIYVHITWILANTCLGGFVFNIEKKLWVFSTMISCDV